MMNGKTLLCLGCGYTAQHLASSLTQNGWTIFGTTRSESKAESLRAVGITPIIWDGSFNLSAPNTISSALISTPPNEQGCPSLNCIESLLNTQQKKLTWIGYLSSNGVYGDHQGEWVDENSLLLATSDRSKRRITSEQAWQAFGAQTDTPVKIFRLPGIYGPERSALDSVRAGKAKRIYKEEQVFSRAHIDDIITALALSLNNPEIGDIFNVADDEPAPPQDVVQYACTLLNLPVPPLVPLEDAPLSDMARSFYRDNKRVKNQRIKDTLKLTLKYPSYREGLNAILQGEKTPK